MLKIFIAGWAVLVVAILLNVIANRLGIDTWYSFVVEIEKQGAGKAFMKISLASKVFLFIVYPFLLGIVAYLVLRSFK